MGDYGIYTYAKFHQNLRLLGSIGVLAFHGMTHTISMMVQVHSIKTANTS
jgi:hypothetical protein